jgi:digeranylgeranylglycerophospholipid reductase
MFDVAIIGAGPAGLTLAKELSPNLKVILIDKKREPHKLIACAEWVPPMLPVEAVTFTDSMVTKYDGLTIVKDFSGKIIDRESWQQSLLESLSSTEVHLGELVVTINGNDIVTNKSKYQARIIVGADGPLSIVRKSYGLPISPVLPAINVKLKAKQKFNNTLIHFLPQIEKGYGWLFPKGDFVNVGVGATSHLAEAIIFYIAMLAKEGLVYTEEVQRTSGLIPLYGFNPIASDNSVLIGDAAGLTDPLTGAGIYAAWDSALMLAKTINDDKKLSDYTKKIMMAYGSFLQRRLARRAYLENNWVNLKTSVEGSWIAFK